MPKIIITLFLLSFISSAYAADPLINAHKKKGAIRGYDTVAYFDLKPGDKAVKGKKEISTIWQGARWHFSTEENRRRFEANPAAYAPQYGGYCAFATGKNFTTSIRPDSWQIVDGKLYLNHNKASFKMFNKDVEARIEKANNNWPEVLKACEKHRNCRKPIKL